MLTQEELDSIPDDPDAGLARLLQILEDKFSPEENNFEEEQYYAQTVFAYIEEYSVDSPLNNFKDNDIQHISQWWSSFRSQIVKQKASLMFRQKKKKDKRELDYVEFTPDRRRALHGLIGKIRDSVAEIDLDAVKRDRIFSKLNDLAKEIDRARTPLKAVTEVILELSSTAGQAADRLKPVSKFLREISGYFHEQREEQGTTPALAPPQKQLPAPDPFAIDEDDD